MNDIRAGPAGIEPAYAGLRPAANPSQLETLGRETGTRTPSTWSQARRAYPYTTSRSGPAESNRVSPDSGSGRLPSSSIPNVLCHRAQHGGDGGNRTRCDDACRACPLPQLSSPWNWRDLNARPPACHAGALPTELQPQGAMRRPVQPVPGSSWALFRRIATFGRHGGLPFMVLTLWRCQ